jgi:hypothetical protein
VLSKQIIFIKLSYKLNYKLSSKFTFILIVFITISTLPNYFKEIFQLSSTTQFYILLQLIFLLYINKKIKLNKYILLAFTFFYIFYLIVLLLRINHGFKVDWLKFNTFFFFIFITYLNSINIRIKLISLQNEQFRTIIKYIIYSFTIGAALALFGFTAFGKILERKPVFFFSEPSHFALAISPFLFTYLEMEKTKLSKLILLFFIIFAILYKSLTLLIVLSFYFIFFKKLYNIRTLLFFIISFFILISSTYFLNRIPKNDEDSKESYSYLQGIEQIINTYNDGNYFGIGPQQMGINDPKGDITEIIYQTNNGVYLNQYDGSIGFSKLLVEFGLFGIILCILLLLFVYRVRKNVISNSLTIKNMFLYSSSISALIYLFVRGGGYFCSTYFFLFLFLLEYKNIKLTHEL